MSGKIQKRDYHQTIVLWLWNVPDWVKLTTTKITGSPKTLGLQRGRMSKQIPAANRTEKDKSICKQEEKIKKVMKRREGFKQSCLPGWRTASDLLWLVELLLEHLFIPHRAKYSQLNRILKMKLKATGLVQNTKKQSGCLSRHLQDYDDLDYKRLRQNTTEEEKEEKRNSLLKDTLKMNVWAILAELQLSFHGVKASTWRTEAVIGPV